jgi:hypothetical protein
MKLVIKEENLSMDITWTDENTAAIHVAYDSLPVITFVKSLVAEGIAFYFEPWPNEDARIYVKPDVLERVKVIHEHYAVAWREMKESKKWNAR